MIAGPWDDEFVVVSPGETITYEMFTQFDRVHAMRCPRSARDGSDRVSAESA